MNNFEELRKNIDGISSSSVKELEKEICNYLDRCGLFYKVFLRVKSGASIEDKLYKKIREKGEEYKMQDLIGIRIVLYFKEDISLCEKIIDGRFMVDNVAKNEETTDKFCPMRNNRVCRLPEKIANNLDSTIWSYPIDKTFEVQLRTVFSEGWHEIEHDFRYKCKEAWAGMDELERTLNGVFATLDNCDWTIESLLDKVAYCHYKNRNWEYMLQNKLRIRIKNEPLSTEITDCFNENTDTAKAFFRADRTAFLLKLSDMTKVFPLTLNNIVYLLNEFQIHDPLIDELTPTIIKKRTEDLK